MCTADNYTIPRKPMIRMLLVHVIGDTFSYRLEEPCPFVVARSPDASGRRSNPLLNVPLKLRGTKGGYESPPALVIWILGLIWHLGFVTCHSHSLGFRASDLGFRIVGAPLII